MRQSLSFAVQVSLARLAEIVTVRTGCSGVSESGANIIFTLRMLRSLSRIYNVFLTKMDALLPVTQHENSLSELSSEIWGSDG